MQSGAEALPTRIDELSGSWQSRGRVSQRRAKPAETVRALCKTHAIVQAGIHYLHPYYARGALVKN